MLDAHVAEQRRGAQVVEPKAKACAPCAAFRLALAHPVLLPPSRVRRPAPLPAPHATSAQHHQVFT
jgi:hypothetical protein